MSGFQWLVDTVYNLFLLFLCGAKNGHGDGLFTKEKSIILYKNMQNKANFKKAGNEYNRLYDND